MTYTLITGASSGIGLELAKVAAQNKQNLILVARSLEPLEALAQELRTQYNVEVQVIPMDLSQGQSAQALYDVIHEKNLKVEALINNAGFGDHGLFIEAEWPKFRDMIQVNITTLTELTHLFLPAMIKERRGHILNVSSIAAFQPGPLMAVYYATKAYVQSFSEALAEELKNTGVTVTALCPGPTASGFQATAKMENIPLFQVLGLPTSKDVALYGYEAMKGGQRIAIHGRLNQLIVQSLRLTPRKWSVKLVRRLQEKRRTE